MANPYIDNYRKQLAAMGSTDPRSDAEVAASLGVPLDMPADDDLSIGSELASGLKRGVVGLGALGGYAAGLGAGLVGANETGKNIVERTKQWEEDNTTPAAVPTMGDVHSVTSGANYLAGKVGEIAPMLVEGLLTGGAGAVGGEALSGASAGIAKWLAGRASTQLLKKKTEEIGAEAAAKYLASDVGKKAILDEAGVLAKSYGGHIATSFNAFLLSAPSIYAQTGDPGLSVAAGAVGGVGGMMLPDALVQRYLGQTPAAATIMQKLAVAAKHVGLGVSGMELQELAYIAAEKYHKGEDATLTDADVTRLKEAAVGGAIAGGLGSAIDPAMHGGNIKPPPKITPEMAAARAREAITEEDILTPDEKAESDRLQAAAMMTPEQTAERIALLEKLPKRTNVEDKELNILLAKGSPTPAKAAAAAATDANTPPPPAPPAPAPEPDPLSAYGAGLQVIRGKPLKVVDGEGKEQVYADAGRTLADARRDYTNLKALLNCVGGKP